jgi:uncharacterized repeat protein (TIGR03803 family)
MGKLDWAKQAGFAILLCATTAIALPAQSSTALQSGSITAVVPNETIALPAQTFRTLHSFDYTDGRGPDAGLVQATDGNLYGTTGAGGAGWLGGEGTVFKITPSGTLTTLYSFCMQIGCPDGEAPVAGLVQATDGNFYGTASCAGGIALCDGTVFKITPAGTLTTLHSFGGTDGTSPFGGLVQATDGNLYGTTWVGGTYGVGTVFKITPGGMFTTLLSFDGTDGSSPWAGLVQGTDGNLYGTTWEGGTYVGGTVFKITPGGMLTTLHSFDGTDGWDPKAGLVQATDGNLYGTTISGGGNVCDLYGSLVLCGAVFKITPGGMLTTLHSFDGTDGWEPIAGVVQATDGNFYGTTPFGGANSCESSEYIVGCGTVFKIIPSGMLTTLHSFDGTDGWEPIAGLVQATDGNFYGTTCSGGANGYGTVFSMSVGLPPFVETQPTSGKVGAAVEILGSDLTDATSVTFNGTAAPFKVVSSSQITTDVPAGATTGKVQVVTPSGTLLSNVPFRVLPSLRFSPMSPGGEGSGDLGREPQSKAESRRQKAEGGKQMLLVLTSGS